MKNFFIISFLIAFLLLLYPKREEVKVSLINALSYVEKLPFVTRNSKIVNTNMPEVVATVRSIVTPGALKVLNKINLNNSNVVLTKEKVIELTNHNRKDNGNLASLIENNKLNASAEIKMKDMFSGQYFEHVSPSGINISNLGDRVGYEYIVIGENLAMGNFNDNKDLVDAWMASPGHRANILNKRYAEIGVAVGRGKYEGRDVWMAVQHFGLPKNSCPAIDESLKNTISDKEIEIKTMVTELAIEKANIASGEVRNGKTNAEQVVDYNILVGIYNKLVNDIKDKINTYNIQVRAFNACANAN